MRVSRTQKWPLSDTIKFKITQIHFFRVTFFDVFSSVLPSWLLMLLSVLMEDVLLSNSIGGSRRRSKLRPKRPKKISPPPPPPQGLGPALNSDFLEPIWNNFYLEHCQFF